MSPCSSLASVLFGTLLVVGCDGIILVINPTPVPCTSSVNSAPSVGSTSACVTSSSIIPIPPNAVIVDPSTGEGVRVTGTIHVATAVTVDGTGATHTEMHFDVQGVSGVGLISGTHYQGIRTDTLCSNSAESVPSHFTTRIDINLISQGARGDLTIRDALLRVTVNADRTVTVQSVTLA